MPRHGPDGAEAGFIILPARFSASRSHRRWNRLNCFQVATFSAALTQAVLGPLRDFCGISSWLHRNFSIPVQAFRMKVKLILPALTEEFQ